MAKTKTDGPCTRKGHTLVRLVGVRYLSCNSGEVCAVPDKIAADLIAKGNAVRISGDAPRVMTHPQTQERVFTKDAPPVLRSEVVNVEDFISGDASEPDLLS